MTPALFGPSEDGTVLLAEVTRGLLVESSHRGALAVVDTEGRLLAAAGDPLSVVYLRSAAKQFQALPAVASGALDHFGLDDEALDDTLMRGGGLHGPIVSKGGAEGYQGLGIRTPDGQSVGVALKIADGNPRAKGPVIYAVLDVLHLVSPEILARLESLRRPAIANHRRQVVGEIRPAFALAQFTPPQPQAEVR